MKKLLIVLPLAAGLLLSACTHQDSVPESNPDAGNAAGIMEEGMAPEAPVGADDTNSMVKDEAMMDSEAQEIEVEAGAFYYAPDTIRVKKGQEVTIVMNSVDMMHDLVIDELGVKLPVTKSGETNTVTFTADQVGEFTYYCSVGSHRQQGQEGTLIVEE